METIDSFWVAMVVALSLKAILLQPFTIPSGSMEDTLLVGDYILVKKYEYGFSLLNQTQHFLQFKKPRRREILVFVYPGDHSKDYIKRCIGLPGDAVELRKGDLYVNQEKQVEPYVKHLFTPAQALEMDGPLSPKVNFGPVTVAPGHYFMMGDNRDNSSDSRYWGQVEEKFIKGKAWVIYWHSVGFANFAALLAMAVALVSAILLALAWRSKRRSAGSKPEKEGGLPTPEALLTRDLLVWVVVASLVAGAMVVWSGPPAFKESLKTLKSRMFTVVR